MRDRFSRGRFLLVFVLRLHIACRVSGGGTLCGLLLLFARLCLLIGYVGFVRVRLVLWLLRAFLPLELSARLELQQVGCDIVL